jgi:hypothetical protein
MESPDPFVLCAMCAAEDLAFGLDTMADHAAVAVGATRCQGVNGTFEAVEHHGLASKAYAEGLVVVVAANITPGHGFVLTQGPLDTTAIHVGRFLALIGLSRIAQDRALRCPVDAAASSRAAASQSTLGMH